MTRPRLTTRTDTADGRTQAAEALAELHTRLLDTIKGFETVLEKAEPEFRPIATDFRALHGRQSATVARMLSAMGHNPAKDGSMFGAVNSAVVTIRSWFDDISTNIIDALVQGEKHVLDAYDSAIEHVTDPAQARTLREHRAALVSLLDRHAGPHRRTV